MEVFKQFEGQLLAADENPEIVEGKWQRKKVILMKFSDKQAFEDWAFSAEYQEISKDRKAGSEGVVLLVNSLDL